MARPPHLTVLPGGRSGAPPALPRPRPLLRVLGPGDGRGGSELERALAEAVAEARAIRREIERRIAAAFDRPGDA